MSILKVRSCVALHAADQFIHTLCVFIRMYVCVYLCMLVCPSNCLCSNLCFEFFAFCIYICLRIKNPNMHAFYLSLQQKYLHTCMYFSFYACVGYIYIHIYLSRIITKMHEWPVGDKSTALNVHVCINVRIYTIHKSAVAD